MSFIVCLTVAYTFKRVSFLHIRFTKSRLKRLKCSYARDYAVWSLSVYDKIHTVYFLFQNTKSSKVNWKWSDSRTL